MAEIRVIVLEQDKLPVLEMIENKLEVFQKLVGGYIQHVKTPIPFTVVVCDEDGRMKNLPVIARVSAVMPDLKKADFIINTTGRPLLAPGEPGYFEIVGTKVLFVRVDPKSGEYVSLTDEDITKILGS
jgi:hypothetical protein